MTVTTVLLPSPRQSSIIVVRPEVFRHRLTCAAKYSAGAGPVTKFINPSTAPFLFCLLSYLSVFNTLVQDVLWKALRRSCMPFPFSFGYICFPSACDFKLIPVMFRKTVVPSPSLSLRRATTWSSSWSRLSPTRLPRSTSLLSTPSSTPWARSLRSRVPMASFCPRSLLWLSMVGFLFLFSISLFCRHLFACLI